MDQKQMRYRRHWDSYWRQIVANNLQGRVLWESAPERSAWEDMERFRPYINEALPLLDLGCGSGKQTRFLARHFGRVIGVDVSPAVVEHAQQTSDDNSSVEWRVFNALNTKEAEALHAELGDMNIYVRGVFHVIDEKDRDIFVSTLETLLGAQGTLYQIELTVEALAYVRAINHDGSLRFPKVVQPTGFNISRDKEKYFPGNRWMLLDEGENVTLHTVALKNGEEGAVPANYLVLRRRVSNQAYTEENTLE
jgi:SAM-dependent methyltransferase